MRTFWAVTLALAIACLPLSRWLDEFASVAHLVGYELVWWALVAAIVFYVRGIEHRSLASLGFTRPGRRGWIVGGIAGVLIVVVLALVYLVIFPAIGVNEDADLGQIAATPAWWRAVSVVRAAVGEEVVFRGFAIERGGEVLGSRTRAATVSCVAFTLAHAGSWGWSHVIVAGIGGISLTLLYLWKRNLWINILAHAIVDGAAMLA